MSSQYWYHGNKAQLVYPFRKDVDGADNAGAKKRKHDGMTTDEQLQAFLQDGTTVFTKTGTLEGFNGLEEFDSVKRAAMMALLKTHTKPEPATAAWVTLRFNVKATVPFRVCDVGMLRAPKPTTYPMPEKSKLAKEIAMHA